MGPFNLMRVREEKEEVLKIGSFNHLCVNQRGGLSGLETLTGKCPAESA